MNRKQWISAFLLLMAVLLFSVPAAAKWEQEEEGTWTYTAKNGKVRKGTYFSELEMGIVKIGPSNPGQIKSMMIADVKNWDKDTC